MCLALVPTMDKEDYRSCRYMFWLYMTALFWFTCSLSNPFWLSQSNILWASEY
uniref:Uncharacterized protein n=1 Tax=Rhizophora mucronata TaxID=61149 RepID=A0A2P2IRF3_RHIMU